MLLTNSQIKNTLALKIDSNSNKIYYKNLFNSFICFCSSRLDFSAQCPRLRLLRRCRKLFNQREKAAVKF